MENGQVLAMLVTFEGIDGSGKSSVCAALKDEFPNFVYTQEPTDSWYGSAVTQSIHTEDADPLAELFLYTADHADHLSRVITPALEAGHTVISDRYSDSRFAYQGVTLADQFDDPIEYIKQLHAPWTRDPDHTFYFDVPPAVGAERSGATNKFEHEQYLQDVVVTYERLISEEPDRFIRIDATQSPTDVTETVVDHITSLVS